MIIYEDDELVIPSGIGPTINTSGEQIITEKKTVNITANGYTKVIPGLGFDALSECDIITNVPTQIRNQSKTTKYTSNGEYTVTPDPNYTGIKRIDITVDLPEPPLQEKTVDSSNNFQEVIADFNYYGLSKVRVNAIKGQNKTLDSSTSVQTVTSDSNYDALSSVTVNPYTLDEKTVNSSTNSQEITSDVDGLRKVTINPYVLDSKIVDSSTNEQVITSSEDGLSSVTVNPYILDEKIVDSSTKVQVITSDEDGLKQVTINPYVLSDLEVDSSTVNQEFTGQYGTVTVNKYELDKKTVNSSTNEQIVTSSKDGLSKVTVNPYRLDSKTVDSSTASQVITSDVEGLSSVTVNPYVLDSKTVDPSSSVQVVTSDVDGLSSVTVNKVNLNEYTVSPKYTFTPSSVGELVYTDPSTGSTGFSRIGQYRCYKGTMTLDASINDVTISKSDYFQAPPYNMSATNAAFNTDITSVKINKVTSAIDSNIQPQNIVEGVSILGVQGTYALQEKTVDSSTALQVLTPESGYNGFSTVTVNPYYTLLQDKTIDPVYNQNGDPQIITYDSSYGGLNSVTVNRANLEIRFLGGWYVGPDPSSDPRVTYFPGNRQDIIYHPATPGLFHPSVPVGTINSFCSEFNITPGFIGYRHIVFNRANIVQGSTFSAKTYDQLIDVTKYPYTNPSEDASTNYVDGVNKFTIKAVDASIDGNIQAENIKNGVSILGVQGTYEGGPLETITVDSSTTSQVLTPSSGNYGLGSVTINPYVLDSKTVDPSTNSQTVTSDVDGLSSVTVNPYVLDSKTVDSSTVSQTITSSEDGLSSVTINPYVLDSKIVNSSTNEQVVTSSEDGLSSVTVEPYVLDSKTVDSSTASQTVVSDVDGLSSVTVNPYTLDEKTVNSSTNEQVVTSDADGLKKVTINPYVLDSLEVDSSTATQELSGQYGTVKVNPYTLDSKTVNSSTNEQTITSDVDGLSSVTVTPYVLDSKTVDSSTVSQTIISSEDGLSSVTVNPYVLDSSTVDPSTNQIVVTSAEDGLSSVTINGVTSSIDSNILAGNIKDGITILGVQGTFEGGTLQTVTVDSSTESQLIEPDFGNYGLSSVTINPYTLDSSSLIITENGDYAVESTADGLSRVDVSVNIDTQSYYDSGYSAGEADGIVEGIAEQKAKLDSSTLTSNGTYTREDGWNEITVDVDTVNNQNKTVDSSTVSQLVQADHGYTGLGQVTVNPYTLDSSSATITENGDYVFTSGVDGLSRVDVSVNIDTSTYYNNGYTVGETAGIAEGIAQQKSLLDSSTFTANATYTRTDGWDEITVAVPIPTFTTQSKTVNSSTNSQEVEPDSGYNGLSKVTVNPYTLDSKTVDSSTNSQTVVSSADGLSSVIVNPYVLDSSTVDPSTNQITVTSAEDGLSSVTVNAVTSSIDANIAAGNIKDGVTILGVQGTYTGTVINNQNKSIDSSTAAQSVTYDSGYTGLGTVTITALNLDSIYNTLAAY